MVEGPDAPPPSTVEHPSVSLAPFSLFYSFEDTEMKKWAHVGKAGLITVGTRILNILISLPYQGLDFLPSIVLLL